MKRILVVDDEANLAELLYFNPKQSGFETDVARDGLQAVHKARTLHPDLIVLDLMLPELDGFAVCEILRSNRDTARIPIIMLTGWTSELSRIIGLKAGATEYLTKPFSPREIVNRIERILTNGPDSPATKTA